MILKIGNDPSLVAVSQRLRHRVFIEEQGVPEDEVFDGRDEGAIHIALTNGHEAAAALRLTKGEDAWTVNLVAVDKSLRGQHHGEAILCAAIEYARAHDARALWLTAQDQAAGFYAKYGFEPCGKPIVFESGFVLIPMRLELH